MEWEGKKLLNLDIQLGMKEKKRRGGEHSKEMERQEEDEEEQEAVLKRQKWTERHGFFDSDDTY